MENERENKNNQEYVRQYQLDRAEKYVEEHDTSDSEPSLECCIISDLLRIIKYDKK